MDSTKCRFSDHSAHNSSVLDLTSSAVEATTTAAELTSYRGETFANAVRAKISVPLPHWKRALDIACILMATPLLLPLLLLIAILIKLKSSGPVLFKQERVGYRGKRFKLLKFRSMKVGADTTIHQQHLSRLIDSRVPMMKLDSRGDQRLIPYGRLLRASGLDELPQVINVLRGEMSLVGPRPCIPFEYERYLPWQKERFEVVPGLTGLWQVSGKNKTTFDEMVHLDIRYARNKSLGLDIKILLRTLPAVIDQVRDIVVRRKLRMQANAVKVANAGLNTRSIDVANEMMVESETTAQI